MPATARWCVAETGCYRPALSRRHVDHEVAHVGHRIEHGHLDHGLVAGELALAVAVALDGSERARPSGVVGRWVHRAAVEMRELNALAMPLEQRGGVELEDVVAAVAIRRRVA